MCVVGVQPTINRFLWVVLPFFSFVFVASSIIITINVSVLGSALWFHEFLSNNTNSNAYSCSLFYVLSAGAGAQAKATVNFNN